MNGEAQGMEGDSAVGIDRSGEPEAEDIIQGLVGFGHDKRPEERALFPQGGADLRQDKTHTRVEKEANTFASAFLMPATTFSKDVMDTSLDGFLKLKSKWGVSVQAMVVRSRDLGIIDEWQYQELFKQISQKGWRKAKGEPFDDLVPTVQSSLGKRSLELLETNGIIHSWEIPSELPLPAKILNNIFQTNLADFEPIELKNIILFDQYIYKKK